MIYFVAIILGGYVGFGMEKISVYMINKRVSEPIINKFSGNTSKTLMWMAINALMWFLVILIGGLNVKTIEIIILISASVVVSAIDLTIRKIANEVILFILVVGVVFVVINGQLSSISQNIIAFTIGFIMFFLPSMIGKGAGWGDVKYAAVLGFCLGIYNFLTAVILMTLILLIYTIYLMTQRKGNLKTKIALGPFMTVGFVIVLILNIVNTRWMIFDLQTFLHM